MSNLLLNIYEKYKGALIVFGLGFTAGAIKVFYYQLKEFRANLGSVNTHRAITSLNRTCRACIYMRRICSRGETECSFAILSWIVNFLESAETSIDAAIYLVTCIEFKDAFIKAHNRGVRVRFISDSMMAYGTGSAVAQMRLAGIEVRHSVTDERHMMHRKSVVVDQKMVLMGTGNWTMQSLCGNWDGFVKTNTPVVVKGFVKVFESEWKLLEDCQLPPVNGASVPFQQ